MNINKEQLLTYLLYYICIGVVTYFIFVVLRYAFSKSFRAIIDRQLYYVIAHLTKGSRKKGIAFIIIYTLVTTTLTWPLTYLAYIKITLRKLFNKSRR